MKPQTAGQSMRPHAVSPPRGHSRGSPSISEMQSATDVRPSTTSRLIDKTSVLWRDFMNGCRRRIRLLNQAKELANDDTTTPSILKKYLLDLRQLTLKVIEDALEIEYRSQLGVPGNFMRSIPNIRLPPIQTYKTIQNKDDLYVLANMINDVDELYKLPNIRVILPMEFPGRRNPFLLGKNVDELAALHAPPPTPGKLDEELKVLELLRYKRAAKALLRAETQVLNKLPLNLTDIEQIWIRMVEDSDLDLVIRCICTILKNENYDPSMHDEGPYMQHLAERVLSMEPHDFLSRLNTFSNTKSQMRIDTEAMVRHTLKGCNFRKFNDETSSYLVEWLNSALGGGPVSSNAQYKTVDFDSSVSVLTDPQLMQPLVPQNYEDKGSRGQQRPASTSPGKRSAEHIVREKSITKVLTVAEKIQQEEKREAIRKKNDKVRKRLPDIIDKPNLSDDLQPMDSEAVAALRYEFMKMQKELLRRKVLDPRHYNAVSIDTTVKDLKSATFNGNKRQEPDSRARRELILFEKEFNTAKYQYTIEMYFHIVTERIIFRAFKVHNAYSVMFSPAYSIGERQLIHTMDFSRVLFSRVTNSLFENFFKDDQSIRALKVGPIVSQIEASLRLEADVEEIYPICDRILFNKSLAVDGIGVDVFIERNTNCTGLNINISPQKGMTIGQADGGSVSLVIYDKELLVLMVNQRGLYVLAQTKWESLLVLADWLVSRINIKRIFVRSAPVEESLGKTKKLSHKTQTPKNDFKDINMLDKTSSDHANETVDVELQETEKLQVLLDVKIDRSVHIERTAFLQWRSRKVPKLQKLNCKLFAFQENETLRLDVHLKVPHPKSFKTEELIDFSKYYEDEEFFDVTDTTEYPPTDITLSYALTGHELMVFGSAKVMEEHNVSMSALPGLNHPAEFMLNVISRLKVTFKGDLLDPYNSKSTASNRMNWEVTYDRRLFRDIRTVTGGVMMITASVIGSQVLFDAEPTDGSIYKAVGSKLMEDTELQDLVFGEGWPVDILEPAQRSQLAFRTLEKLKVIEDKKTHRLELYNFPETRLLIVSVQTAVGRPEKMAGTVEINEFLTLTDLRTIIQYELDRERVPKSYQFLYKGSTCAYRQESMRRAWDMIPKCTLIPRKGNEEKEKEKEKNEDTVTDKQSDANSTNAKSLEASMTRRVTNKLVPVPIPTLAWLQEETGVIHLLHPRSGLLNTGDILKIGNIKGRDYNVVFMDAKTQQAFPYMCIIEPAFSMLSEIEFEKPTTGNMPWPKPSTLDPKMRKWIPKDVKGMGLKYRLPQKSKEDEMKSTKVSSNTTSSNSEVVKAIERGKGGKLPVKPEAPVKVEDEPRSGGLVWVDVWLWRMIPNGEDNRPKWRRQYDNGEIKYKYDYQSSDEGVTFFGVSVKWKVIEILCADVRVPELAVHHQRIDEMDKLSIDDYTTIAFQRMTSWFPQFDQGIELNKFMKMIKETKIFPDIKKPARIGQLEQLFQQELKTEDSIIDKYVNYAAFCRLLQEVALIRYPPGQKLNTDENASIGSTEEASDLVSLASELSGSNNSMSSSKVSKSKPRNEKEEKRAKKMADAAIANNTRVFVSPEEAAAAYRNLVTDFLLNIPEWSAHVWQQAKLTAMKKESRLYAAATRIMTVFRGKRIKRYYRQLKRAIVTLQAHSRRKSTIKKIRIIKKFLFEDWLFRRRYQAATLFVALVRRFLARTRKIKIYKRLNEQQVKVSKANRKRKAKMHAKDRQSVLFKVMARISGMSLLVCVKRKDQRSYSKDYSMVIEVYLPLTQETFKFIIEEDELRGFMQAETGLSVLSAEQILNKGNIQKVLNARLMVKVSNKPGIKPRVMFSRQALGQRGMKCMTKGKMIGNDMFVCSLYQSAADISIQCYHRLTCKVFTANISTDMLKEWITFDHRQNCKTELELYTTPYLLQPDNVATLHYWLICNLIADTRHRKFAIIFACQLERSKKLAAIVTIQSIWRRALVRQHCPGWVDKYIIIVKSSPAYNASCYYLNLKTGESFWEKPKLLRGNELPTQPMHRWIEINYYIDGCYQKYFVNPYNGFFTQKSLDRAAQIIQAVARKRRLNMHSLSVEAFNRAVKFERAAEVVYCNQKKKLSTVINFALVKHAIDLDMEGARKLYEETMSLSDTNPLVLRSYALFKISFMEAPVQPNYERALVLLKDAKVRDPQALQFMTAYEIVFKYGCYRNPNNCMSYLNLGLAAYYVLGDMKTAEKCCRRAVAMNPFDERVLYNWKMLRDKFPDKLLAIQPRSRIEQNNTSITSRKRIIDGKEYNENPAWAGWLFFEVPHVENEDFIQQEESYWFNPATGEQRLKTPDWASEWYVRATRSRWDGSRDGLEDYFDPLTSSYFQYHALTDSYQ